MRTSRTGINAARSVADPGNDDLRTQGVHRLVAAIEAEPRVSALALQTVGRKGYDGFLMALVNEG